jgi:hypothetical protein
VEVGVEREKGWDTPNGGASIKTVDGSPHVSGLPSDGRVAQILSR